MNIGFEAKRAYFNNTGLGNYSRTLLKNLNNYFPENKYFLYAPALTNNPRIKFIEGKNNITVRTPQQFIHRTSPSLWRSFLMKKDLKQDKLDLFHGLSNELPYSIHKIPIRSVVTIHDLIFLRYPEQYNAVDRKIYELKFKHSCKIADKVLAISEQTKRDIIEFFGIKVNKIEVIYQSCDPIFYEEKSEIEKSQVRLKYQLPENFVLYVGSIIERKNLLTVVKALHQLKNKIPLVIIGDGKTYKEKVLVFIQKNKMQKQIIFIENAVFDDFPAIYQSADLFVFPSLFEGFGIPIIEALWSKTPVITSLGSCFPEAGGASSIYINPKNTDELTYAMERVLNDKILQKKMKEDGYNFVQKFHPKIITKQMMNLYNLVV